MLEMSMDSWLRDFVDSLGHISYEWRDISSIGVKTLKSKVRKSWDRRGSLFRWAEVSESDLKEMSEDDFLTLLMWFTQSKPPPIRRRVIFITGSSNSESIRKGALRQVANVVDIEKEGIHLRKNGGDPMFGIQEPVPRMNYKSSIPGPYPEAYSLATMIPGPEGEFGYNEVTLVIPEVPCEELNEGFVIPEGRRERFSESVFDGEMGFEARDIENHRMGGIEYSGGNDGCFCRILNSSLAHIKSSLKVTGGRAGRIVVIELRRGGEGWENDCMGDFVRELKSLDRYWRRHGPYGGLIWQVREF